MVLLTKCVISFCSATAVVSELRENKAAKAVLKDSVDKNAQRTIQKSTALLPHLSTVSDDGIVLTVRQPFASFIVLGIKKHEGRSWTTSHRGRLWIRSASMHPTVDEVLRLEKFYCKRLDYPLVFPEQYPVDAVLGAVVLDACLHQNEYLETYPHGEAGDDTYAWVFSNPEFLPDPLVTTDGNGMSAYKAGNRQMHILDKRVLRQAQQRLAIHPYADRF